MTDVVRDSVLAVQLPRMAGHIDRRDEPSPILDQVDDQWHPIPHTLEVLIPHPFFLFLPEELE